MQYYGVCEFYENYIYKESQLIWMKNILSEVSFIFLQYYIICRLYNGITTMVKDEKARKVTLCRKDGQSKKTTIRKLADYYKKVIYRNEGDIVVTKILLDAL